MTANERRAEIMRIMTARRQESMGRLALELGVTRRKTFEENEKTMLPLAIQVHHAVCDGYHVGKFIETLQANINKFDV